MHPPTHHLRSRNLGQLQSPLPVRCHQDHKWRNICLPRRQFLETADEELEVLSHSAESGTVLPAARVLAALQKQTIRSSQSRSTELGIEGHLVREEHGLLEDAVDKRNTVLSSICVLKSVYKLLDRSDEDLCFRI